MGFVAALNYTEGIYITMKLILLTVFAAVALAEDAPAEPEAAASTAKAFVYSGLPLHQLHWPGHYGFGYSSQCWGCRGKRSAEAEPGYGYYGYPAYRGYYGSPAYRGYYGYPYGLGVAGHPTGTSYSHRS